MTIDISREARQEAITSIERYFKENMEEPIGNMIQLMVVSERRRHT